MELTSVKLYSDPIWHGSKLKLNDMKNKKSYFVCTKLVRKKKNKTCSSWKVTR